MKKKMKIMSKNFSFPAERKTMVKKNSMNSATLSPCLIESLINTKCAVLLEEITQHYIANLLIMNVTIAYYHSIFFKWKDR